jgi:adenine phosphoribosyltransferase
MSLQYLRDHVRDIIDFPKPGIVFKDITPILGDRVAFRRTVDLLAERFLGQRIDKVVSVESRGFIFGSALAYALGAGMAVVRKPGKLPYRCDRETYALEYGEDCLELHVDAVRRGERVLVVDDLLATGGTARATARLVERQGGEVVACAVVIELSFLNGRKRLEPIPVESLLVY